MTVYVASCLPTAFIASHGPEARHGKKGKIKAIFEIY